MYIAYLSVKEKVVQLYHQKAKTRKQLVSSSSRFGHYGQQNGFSKQLEVQQPIALASFIALVFRSGCHLQRRVVPFAGTVWIY